MLFGRGFLKNIKMMGKVIKYADNNYFWSTFFLKVAPKIFNIFCTFFVWFGTAIIILLTFYFLNTLSKYFNQMFKRFLFFDKKPNIGVHMATFYKDFFLICKIFKNCIW